MLSSVNLLWKLCLLLTIQLVFEGNITGNYWKELGYYILIPFWHAGWKSCDSVPKLVDEYMARKLKVDEFITHTLPLDKINEAFDLMHDGKRLVY